MRHMILVAALALAGCASASNSDPAVTAASCRVEQALYRLRTKPEATMRIVKTPHALNAYSDMAARVDFEGETYWFAFVSSLGYSRNYVGRTQDPFEQAAREDSGEDVGEEHQEPEYDSNEWTPLDADYNVLENVPQNGGPAPAHILASGISMAIWYSVPRRELPYQPWDFVECVDDLG